MQLCPQSLIKANILKQEQKNFSWSRTTKKKSQNKKTKKKQNKKTRTKKKEENCKQPETKNVPPPKT